MSWLDQFLSAYNAVQDNGLVLPQRSVLNFTADATVTDDPTNQRTNVAINATASGTPLATPNTLVSRDGSASSAFGGLTSPELQSTSDLTLAVPGTASLLIDDGDGTALSVVPDSDATTSLAFGSIVTVPQVTQTQKAGTGAAAGIALQVRGQKGQQQSGTNANNAGGDVQLHGGAPGTGGSGAAGAPGAVELFTDSTSLMRVESVSTAMAVLLGSTWSTFVMQPAQPPGLGLQNGGNFTIAGQSGQNVLSGFNKNGGDLILLGGNAGTGGTGGTNGKVHVQSPLTVDDALTFPTEISVNQNTTPIIFSSSGVLTIGDDGSTALALRSSAAVSIALEGLGTGITLDIDGTNLTETLGGSLIAREWLDNTNALAMSFALNGAGATSIILGAGVTSASITQSDKTTNSGTGATFTIQAQNETGTTSMGGNLLLKAGTGTSQGGTVQITGRGATYTFGQASHFGGTSNFIDLGGPGGLVGTAIVSGSTAGDAYYEANGGSIKLFADGAVTAYLGTITNIGNVVLSFPSPQSAATIKQDDLATNSGTGATLTIQAQNETGTASTGGALALKAGTGTTKPGGLSIQGLFQPATTSLTSLTGGTQTLNATQLGTPRIKLSGTLTSGLTIDFGNNVGIWFVNTGGLTFGAFGISFKNGSTTKSVTIPTGQTLFVVDCDTNTVDYA